MVPVFEFLMAFRYLRARRREGFVSVIAGFSLLGIALGVATLIIVMAVMNGFRSELLGRILGLEGHVSVSVLGHAFLTLPVSRSIAEPGPCAVSCARCRRAGDGQCQ